MAVVNTTHRPLPLGLAHSSSIQRSEVAEVTLGILRRDPPVKYDTARAGDSEQVAVPRRPRRVASGRAVRTVVANKLLEVGEKGHRCRSFPLRPARVHGVGEALPPVYLTLSVCHE